MYHNNVECRVVSNGRIYQMISQPRLPPHPNGHAMCIRTETKRKTQKKNILLPGELVLSESQES